MDTTAPAPTDLRDDVAEIVGATGRVKGMAGGVEVRVHDEASFPWPAVFRYLTGIRQDVWVRQDAGTMVVVSKVPSW